MLKHDLNNIKFVFLIQICNFVVSVYKMYALTTDYYIFINIGQLIHVSVSQNITKLQLSLSTG